MPHPLDASLPGQHDELERLGLDSSDGFDIALRRRTAASVPDAQPVYELVVNGMFAMDSVDSSSEVALAALVNDNARRVLVGGLGLGFTAGALLDRLPQAKVQVAELSSALIGWAREHLVPSLARVADDPRAELVHADVADVLRSTSGWDAILLDVDNGPDFLIHEHNAELYADELLGAAVQSLAPGGLLAIWCEAETPRLARSLDALAAGLRSQPGGTTPATAVVSVPVQRDGREIVYAIHCLTR